MKIFDLVEKFLVTDLTNRTLRPMLWCHIKRMAESALSGGVYGGGNDRRYDNTEKVVGLVDECWRMGLKICHQI